MKLKPKAIVVNHDREISVDLFAGGGGASTAYFRATGKHPDVAVNHNPTAISIHRVNHPTTRHLVEDIRKVDPIDACTFDGRLCRVGPLWLSPDCTHFSKARGGKPVEKGIRSLADVLIEWLDALIPHDCHPRAIFLENVEEFKDWGPVLENGKPCPENKGLDFRRWVKALQDRGYAVDYRELIAANYGAPTTRKRLFLVARRDGQKIGWPAQTHYSRKEIAELGLFGKGLKTWRAAAEIIDWSQPVPSIFDRKRPLRDKTKSRIAKGIKRFVIESPNPFIVPVTHTTAASGNTTNSADEPIRTITAAKGGEFAVGAPTILPVNHGGGEERVYDPQDPARTITAAPRGEQAVAVPTLVPRYGEAPGQDPRARDGAEPYPTVVPKGNGGDLQATVLQKMAQNGRGTSPTDPLDTVMAGATKHHHVAAYLGREFGSTVSGRDAQEPHPTVMTDGAGGKSKVIAASLVGVAHGDDAKSGERHRDAADPLKTVTSSNDHAVAAAMLQANGDRVGREAEEPVTTLTGRSTQQNVMAVSLDSYYGNGSPASAADALRTVTGHDRHAVTGVQLQAGFSVGTDNMSTRATRAFGADEPLRTVTSRGAHAAASAFMEQANTGMVGHDMHAPVSTIVGKGCTQRLIEMGFLPAEAPETSRRAKVLDFLWSHFGAPTEEEWADPLATMQGRLRFGLVVLEGQTWQIVDIGMRMLTPRELFNAQGFPGDYVIDMTLEGVPVTKTAQTAMAGNSVSPPPAEALLRANLTWMKLPERMAA